MNAEYHYVFYFIHTYFKLNGGLTDANKIFVADRLQKIATWLYDPSVGTHLDYDQKRNIAIWSVKYLLENPNVIWEDFKNQFLTSQCEKIKKSTDNSTFKGNITNLEGKTGDGYENGWRMNYPIPNGSTNDFIQNSAGTNFVNFTAFPNTFALLHSHYEELYPIFSPEDIIFFNSWVNSVYANSQVTNPSVPIPPLGEITFTVVTSYGNYIFMFDSNVIPSQLPTYTAAQIDDLNEKYTEKYLNNAYTNGIPNMDKLEKEFLKFMRDQMSIPGLKLYKSDSTGNTEVYLEGNSRITKKCP